MTADEEDRWETMLGGYRVPYDPRPALARLRKGDSETAWPELWNELHHQGDVHEASYATVPELVAIYEARAVPDWNTYALVGTIELERGRGSNPDVPTWVAVRYQGSLTRLAELALVDIKDTDHPLILRSALAIIAIVKGLREHGRMLLELDESEIEELIADS